MDILLSIIDHPETSDDFIAYSARMASDLNSNLHLLYVQDAESYPFSTGTTGISSVQMEQNLKTERENAIKILEDRIADQGLNISSSTSVEVAVETGSRVLVIDNYVNEYKVSMVVLKGQELSGFWSLGITNMDVILKLNCPVWVIPENITYKPYRKIVYATDFNEADIKTLQNLIGITQTFSPTITALHVTESSDFEEKLKKTGFRDMVVKSTQYEKIFFRFLRDESDGDMADNVNGFARSIKADLIVLLKENRSFFERIFKASSTGKIIKQAALPVLVYHEKAF